MSTCYTIEKAEYRALKDENAELRDDLLLAQRIIGQISHEGFELIDDNEKLRELLQRLLTEYRYMRSRPRRVYLQHEGRMRAIEEEMRELGIEVPE